MKVGNRRESRIKVYGREREIGREVVVESTTGCVREDARRLLSGRESVCVRAQEWKKAKKRAFEDRTGPVEFD